MSTQVKLRNLAIKNAKAGNWQEAVKNNEEILAVDPDNTNALNRLAVAYTQLNKPTEAKRYFKLVLKIDVNNKIAKKHLERLKNNKTIITPSFTKQQFIEEPGKTKTVALLRLAGSHVLENVSVGQSCELKIKTRFISIESNGHYLGTLPEDLSFRLSKLIKTGNQYHCYIRSCSPKQCHVYLKEQTQSAKNAGIHSFPPKDIALNPLSEVNNSIILEENIPVEIVQTDNDVEKTLDDLDPEDIIKN